ncbi:metallophosphoesterase [Corallococcus exiguus]|uniref:metallophosphoesterase n=1 Tax=Corallococcus exiguus TaxID=83462 RepID=UPI001C12DF98
MEWKTVFHLATGILGLFVIVRFIAPLPWSMRLRMALSVTTALVSLHHLFSRIAGTMFSPEVPRAAIIAVNWLFGTILLIAVFQLVLDIATALRALVRRRWVSAPTVARYVLGMAALSLAAFGVNQAARVPPVKHIEIAIRDLPREFDGFRVVQLTDLHLSRLFEAPWAEAVVRETNALKPDLIVITGDLIDGTLENRRHDIEPLKKLSAAHGVYVSPGNHEYYFGYSDWMARFKELGLRPLANAHTVLRRGGAELVLAGVTDPTALASGLPGPDVHQAIAGAPAGVPILLLNHQPKQAALSARAGASLQLSGHTHGGMIVGFDRLIARFNNGYVSGRYDVEGMPLYVSNGTALWLGFALRMGVPSELTSIVLRAA